MRSTRAVSITLWLLLLLACALIIERTQFSADLTAFMPSEPTKNQKVFIDQLKSGAASRLILVGIEGADTETLVSISREMSRQLRLQQAFTLVNNGEAVDDEEKREFIYTHRYLLSPAVDAERFTSAGLHDAISESIALLASPAGLLVKPLLTRDPTGETVQLLNSFNHDAGPQIYDGVWVSPQGERAILLLQTQVEGSDIDGQQHAMAIIQTTFEQITKAEAVSARLLMSGPGIFSVTSRETIKEEVKRLSIVSTVIIITLLLLLYRSFTAVLLGTIPVFTGIVVGIAAVSLGFGMVHGVTLGFGITLIGEAIDYSIYLFLQSKYSREEAHNQGWLSSFWPTIRLGVLTSIVGFSVLLFSGFPGLAQLGLYSSAGLIAAALVTRFVLPVLLPSNFHVRDVTRFGGVLIKVSHHAVPLRYLTALLLLAACTIIYIHRDSIWNTDLAALSPVSDAERALDTLLRSDLGAPNPRYLIVVSGDSIEAAITGAEKVSAQLEPLVEAGVIAGYSSPSHYLPSLATQRARLAAIPDRDELSRRLQDATADLPLSSERLTGFIDDAQRARHAPPLQLSDLAGTPIALAVESLLVEQEHRWSALIPLQAVTLNGHISTIDPQPIQAALEKASQSRALFIDVKKELDQMYSGYLSEVLYLSLAGFIAIVALLLIALRSPRRVIRLLLPLVLAVIVVIAGLLWSGYRLTILHLIGLLLTVAIGSNYALFFDRRFHQGNGAGYSRTLASLLFANATTVTIFTLLAFSAVPILKNIGMTVAPGVILALLFAAILAERSTDFAKPLLNREAKER